MALEARVDCDEVFACPLMSGETMRTPCEPRDCALGKSFDTGTGFTRWYCGLVAPTYSEANCYVEEKR